MKRIILATASLAAIAAIALPAAAHGPRGDGGKRPAGMMTQLDTDGDGKVSEAEIQAHKDAKFAEIDTNKDGVLSKDEMSAHHKVMAEQMKAGFADGRAERVNEMFDRFDTNKDGSITRDEVTAVQSTEGARWETMRAERGSDWAAKSAEMQDKRFADLDKDGNGTVSKEEFDSARMGPGMAPGMDRGPRGMRGDMPPPPPPEDE
jgi:Ca2+-binding EF-hand superfamily protein